jgi:hypothetical protein
VRHLALSVVTEENLRAIVEQVWESLLFEAPSWADSTGTSEETFASSIDILGDWPARVSLTTATAQAEQITHAMLGLEPTTGELVDVEDVTDALAEMVNVVGGNLKALLPTQSSLGLPHAAALSTQPPLGHHLGALGDPVVRVVFQWRGHPVEVTVRENVAA